jgi:hypothetical protein
VCVHLEEDEEENSNNSNVHKIGALEKRNVKKTAQNTPFEL